jgi:DNA polymerase III subunit epsilon
MDLDPTELAIEALKRGTERVKNTDGTFAYAIGKCFWDTEDCPFCCMERAAKQAEKVLSSNPLFLDFETSTLGGYAVELAIIDVEENVLFNERMNPQVPIDPEASAIHGINDVDVCNAPTFAERHEKIRELLRGRIVVAYNARFDRDVLRSELERMNAPKIKIQWECAMELLMDYHGSEYPEKLGGNHSAVGDCRATLHLVRAIAKKDV